MDWNRIEGNWKQFKGQAKEKWGRLTDDDLDVIKGRQDQLEGKFRNATVLPRTRPKRMSTLGSNHCRDNPGPSCDPDIRTHPDEITRRLVSRRAPISGLAFTFGANCGSTKTTSAPVRLIRLMPSRINA